MSKLSDVLTSFGFHEREEQIALLRNLQVAGYFKDDQVWQAINLSQYSQDGTLNPRWGERSAEEVFASIREVTSVSGANLEDPRAFNAESFLETAFESDVFDRQDVEDMMLYLAQNAFGREQHQERSELGAAKPWAVSHGDLYLENARTLGLLDEKSPTQAAYDESWILGAARLRVTTRAEHLREVEASGVNIGHVRLLTGARELWAEIDKMPIDSSLEGEEKEAAQVAAIEEAKSYMADLATENGITIEGFETREVGSSKRTYLKYAEGETRKVTETLMARRVFKEVFGREIEEVDLLDSKAAAGKMRPDTEVNAADMARQHLARQITDGVFAGRAPQILIVSNQPYADRQVITTERAVRKQLAELGMQDAEIDFEGIGKACEVGVTAVHSETGALVAEGFMREMERNKEARKCDPNQMLFSRRCKDLALLPALPGSEAELAAVGAAAPSTSPEASSAQAMGSAAQAASASRQ